MVFDLNVFSTTHSKLQTFKYEFILLYVMLKKNLSEAVVLLKQNFFYFLLLDFLFAVSLIFVNYLLGFIISFQGMVAAVQQNAVFIIGMVPLGIIYSLTILFVYSSFKYMQIVKLLEGYESMKEFFSFYWLNVKIFLLFFVVFLVINVGFFNIPDEYNLIYVFVTMFPFIVFMSLAFNLLHAEFVHHRVHVKRYLLLIKQNLKLLLYKTVTYIFVLVLYLIYNQLGLAGSRFLFSYSVMMLIIVYLILKLEFVYYLRYMDGKR
jgi:hypothetical protein